MSEEYIIELATPTEFKPRDFRTVSLARKAAIRLVKDVKQLLQARSTNMEIKDILRREELIETIQSEVKRLELTQQQELRNLLLK